MLGGFRNGPSHSILNPLQLLHLCFVNTVVQGIAIVKLPGDKSTGERDDILDSTNFSYLQIAKEQMMMVVCGRLGNKYPFSE